MAGWKSIVEKYITFGFGEKKDHWTCNLCQHGTSKMRRDRIIYHLTRIPGMGVEICPKITSEQVEELKREPGIGPDLTGADGQQPQQPGENDGIRQENGNKKRKGASGSGTGGSNQREAEMSPLGALGESVSFPDGNIWSLQNLEYSIGAKGLRLDNLEHNSTFSVSNSSILPPETWETPMMALSETSHDQVRAYVPNTDIGGFEGTNAVGSFGLSNMIHRGQSSSQGQVDYRNDQHTHPYTSTPRDAFGVEMASEIVVTDEPQPLCPPGFDPDLWELYLKIDSSVDGLSTRGKFSLYKECMSSADEERRKELLGFLEYACLEVGNDLTSAPRNDRNLCRELHLIFDREKISYTFLKGLTELHGFCFRVRKIENKIRAETEQGDEMLVSRRKNDANRWVGYAASFKSDVDDLNVAARNVRSLQLEEILQLLSRANELRKIGEILIETGTALLYPVPKDILSWNPTYMSCRSQLVNQMPMGHTQL